MHIATPDPDPGPSHLASRWWVPVTPGAGVGCCWTVLRICRTPFGERTAVAFSSLEQLVAVFGNDQHWMHLGEPALRGLIEPLGITRITLDPQLTAPKPEPTSSAQFDEQLRALNRALDGSKVLAQASGSQHP